MQEHAAEPNQEHGAKKCHDDADDVDPVHCIWDTKEGARQITSDQSTDDANNNIADETVSATAHHLPGKPAGDESDDNPR